MSEGVAEVGRDAREDACGPDGVPGALADEHQRILFDVFARACPSREVLEHVTGRWGILALAALRDGTFRFNALRRRVQGVSEKMLSQTLQALERDGFVRREVRSSIPPRVDYSLTELGRETAEKLVDLILFVEDRMPEVLDARARHDEAKSPSPSRTAP